MKNRFGLLTLVLLLITPLAAGCQRDRPAPTPPPAATLPAVGTAVPTPPPPVPQTKVALPTQPGQAQATTAVATPSSLGQASPTPPPPKPLAPVNPTPYAATPAPERSFAYTVRPADTLGLIAERFGVSIQAILALNALSNPDVLIVGSALKIPGDAPPEYGGPGIYTVREGDTLLSIALRYGVTVAELLTLNNLSDPDHLFVGQQLRIPTTGLTQPTTTPTRTYVVRKGDTLFSIALKFGVTVWALQVANNISNPDRVYEGQVLKIP